MNITLPTAIHRLGRIYCINTNTSQTDDPPNYKKRYFIAQGTGSLWLQKANKFTLSRKTTDAYSGNHNSKYPDEKCRDP